MERLRAVLVLLKRGSAANATMPTWLYVFKNPPGARALHPARGGSRAHVASSLPGQLGGQLRDALGRVERGSAADRVPPVHLRLHRRPTSQNLPLWYEVGIAGYYSTFQTEGDEARTGMLPEDDLHLLWEGGDVDARSMRLLAAKRDSPEYMDPGPDRRLFFAESWAFAHYLMQGNPSRAPQLGRYMILHQAGPSAGRGVPRGLRDGLRDASTASSIAYIRNNKRFLYNRFKFADLKPPTEATTTPMRYEDVVVRLGDLLAHTKRFADAERYYRGGARGEPEDAAGARGARVDAAAAGEEGRGGGPRCAARPRRARRTSASTTTTAGTAGRRSVRDSNRTTRTSGRSSKRRAPPSARAPTSTRISRKRSRCSDAPIGTSPAERTWTKASPLSSRRRSGSPRARTSPPI